MQPGPLAYPQHQRVAQYPMLVEGGGVVSGCWCCKGGADSTQLLASNARYTA